MKITKAQLREMVKQQLDERCQKGYKTHPTQKTKEMLDQAVGHFEQTTGITWPFKDEG